MRRTMTNINVTLKVTRYVHLFLICSWESWDREWRMRNVKNWCYLYPFSFVLFAIYFEPWPYENSTWLWSYNFLFIILYLLSHFSCWFIPFYLYLHILFLYPVLIPLYYFWALPSSILLCYHILFSNPIFFPFLLSFPIETTGWTFTRTGAGCSKDCSIDEAGPEYPGWKWSDAQVSPFAMRETHKLSNSRTEK